MLSCNFLSKKIILFLIDWSKLEVGSSKIITLLGDNSNYGNDSGLDSDINWRPGFAFLLVLLSGIIGMSAYKELKI